MVATFLQSVLGSLSIDLAVAIALIIIGIIIIVLIRLFIIFLPAILLAAAVWFLTGSTFWAAIVFLIIAAFSLFNKL